MLVSSRFKNTKFYVYGGSSYDNQYRQLKRGVQVVVGTPGRGYRPYQKKAPWNSTNFKFLVWDEADEMCDGLLLIDGEWDIKSHAP